MANFWKTLQNMLCGRNVPATQPKATQPSFDAVDPLAAAQNDLNTLFRKIFPRELEDSGPMHLIQDSFQDVRLLLSPRTSRRPETACGYGRGDDPCREYLSGSAAHRKKQQWRFARYVFPCKKCFCPIGPALEPCAGKTAERSLSPFAEKQHYPARQPGSNDQRTWIDRCFYHQGSLQIHGPSNQANKPWR